MIEYVPAAIAAFNFLSGMNDSEQAPQQYQQPVSPGNPQAAMQFMPQIPMATYNPMMMDQALIEEQMMMLDPGSVVREGEFVTAPPKGLLY